MCSLSVSCLFAEQNTFITFQRTGDGYVAVDLPVLAAVLTHDTWCGAFDGTDF